MVVGFDSLGGRWVSAAEAAGCPSFDDVPPLDGMLHLDSATRQEDAADNGNIIERMPCAVLRPGSVADIAKMIRYCRAHGIKVATRGQAHSTYGQGLVNGLLIENRSLSTIHSIGADSADVDAGVLWQELLLAAYEHGLTPPVLTRYTGLSVGGTLSVGGIGVRNAHGAQIDQVRELEVVTGDGRVQRCSQRRKSQLFEAMLGGLGQCGVITRARVGLVPAKPMARSYVLSYSDNTTFFRDMRTLLSWGELDGVFGLWAPQATSLVYQLNAVAFFDPSAPPDNDYLLRGLSQPPITAVTTDAGYLDWAQQVDRMLAQARLALNWDELVKPWFAVWLDDHAIEHYVSDLVPSLTAADVGPGGQLMLLPQRRSSLTQPFLRVPAGTPWVYLFNVLTTSAQPGPDPAFADTMLARNRRWFDQARDVGGTQYPIGSLEFDHADWAAQYGDLWPRFRRRKRRHDPDRILTPGPGIF
ncbi:MAG: FAD-binding protein [Actinophytocola sp.]|nr:FAD-binding protein [Actinophytocola sp.]